MGPRKGKRTVGVAALILAVLAAAIIVLLSHGDKPPINPINETAAAKADRHERPPAVEPDPIGKRIPNARTRQRRVIRKIIRIRRPATPAAAKQYSRSAPSSNPGGNARPKAKRHRKRSKGGRSTPVTPSTSPRAAAPSAPPATSAPPAATPPAQPSPAPEERPVAIQIEDGDLATGFNFIVYSRGERVRLHVSSDESVVVTIPGYGVTQPVAAGGGALIEFDATSPGMYEVKLQGNKGLVLALLRVKD